MAKDKTEKSERIQIIYPAGETLPAGEIGFLKIDKIQDLLMARFDLGVSYRDVGGKISFLKSSEILKERIKVMKKMLGYCTKLNPSTMLEHAVSIDPLLNKRYQHLWRSHSVSASAFISLGDGSHVKFSPDFFNLPDNEKFSWGYISTPGGAQSGGILFPPWDTGKGSLDELIASIPGPILEVDGSTKQYDSLKELSRNYLMEKLVGDELNLLKEYLTLREKVYLGFGIHKEVKKEYTLHEPMRRRELGIKGFFNPVVLDQEALNLFYCFLPDQINDRDQGNYLPFRCTEDLRIGGKGNNN